MNIYKPFVDFKGFRYLMKDERFIADGRYVLNNYTLSSNFNFNFFFSRNHEISYA
jgi:hypothetical protein